VGYGRGLGERHVHHHQLEGAEGRLHGLRVGRSVERIGAIHPRGAQAVRVVAQHLGREAIGRAEAGDLLLPGHGRTLAAGVAPQGLQPGVQVVRAAAAEVAGRCTYAWKATEPIAQRAR
jgi:hypothetical protein